MNKTIYPNIVRGGIAIPLDRRNYFLVKGRNHEQGGIDIGSNPKTGLEVEDGEIVKMENGGIKVYSAVPMLAGKSPAERVLMGEDPNKVFAAQETFKKVNGLKDDGTKAKLGKRKYIGSNEKTAAKQNADVRRQYWNYDTKLAQVVSDLSAEYGIDPRLVIARLNREGIIDSAIRLNNRIVQGKQKDANDIYDKSILDINEENHPYSNFGLDTIFDRYSKGYVKTNRPIYIKREAIYNEKEPVNTGSTDNMYDTMELFVAELAARQNEVNKKYPNLSRDELIMATNANFNATTKYFKDLMKSGSYKTKYKIEEDVKGINIPVAKKYKQKENNVIIEGQDKLLDDSYDDHIVYSMTADPKLTTIENKSYDPQFIMQRKWLFDKVKINYYNRDTALPYGTNYSRYNPYLDENREEIKRLGGDMKHKLIEVNIGGNSKLIRVPSRSSTGESERSEGRDKAKLGIEYGKLEPLNLKYIPITTPVAKINTPSTKIPITSIPTIAKSNIWGDIIGAGSNIIGSLITRGINNKMIDNLKAPSMPVLETAKKLKTRYNTNSIEERIEENRAAYEREVASNTGSSRIALARNNKGRNLAISRLANLYGQKENIETQLINQDAMNQQTVAARNIERINRHLTDVTNFNNKVTEMRADNNVSTVQNINQGVQDLLARRDGRTSFNKTLMAQTFANPNLPAELFYAAGIWDKNTYDMYRKQYAKS